MSGNTQGPSHFITSDLLRLLPFLNSTCWLPMDLISKISWRENAAQDLKITSIYHGTEVHKNSISMESMLLTPESSMLCAQHALVMYLKCV